jgi:OHCU decarboxylase
MSKAGSLQELNAAPRETALRMLERIVERSSWVAEIVVDQRPFASDQEVARRLVETILSSGFDKQVQLFRAHPELAGREATEGTMTEASTDEQGRLGLTALAAEDAARLKRMNAAYAARFGHPFILALHRMSDLEAVFDTYERRLAASPVEEHVSTLAEIASVIGNRAAQAFGLQSGEDPAETQASAVETDRLRTKTSEARNV